MVSAGKDSLGARKDRLDFWGLKRLPMRDETFLARLALRFRCMDVRPVRCAAGFVLPRATRDAVRRDES